ncbi:MAG TPA: hypothetical protein VNF74_13550 [Terriglobales bacterium]|nr:hypothetical protein [Terriglobales bacterium]
MKQREGGEARRRYWRELIEEQARSGQSAAEFCRARGLWASSFFLWKRKLGEAKAEAASGFVELRAVAAPAPAANAALEVGWAGGPSVWVRAGFEPELLRQVVAALAAMR